jgi:hypothetical protein
LRKNSQACVGDALSNDNARTITAIRGLWGNIFHFLSEKALSNFVRPAMSEVVKMLSGQRIHLVEHSV